MSPATPLSCLRSWPRLLTGSIAAACLWGSSSAFAADGTWNSNTSDNWSTAAKWLGSTIADGVGATANFNFNITATRTITIDTTSRTLGILNIGDTNATHQYTIAASGGALLTLDNTGSTNAQINILSTALTTSITTPMVLNDSLDISNASASLLTISGTVTGGATGSQIITNSGAGTGGTTISGVIADGAGGTVGIRQNSSTSMLTLSAVNTFTGNVTLDAGILRAAGNAANLQKALGNGASQLFLNGGELQLGGSADRSFSRNTTVGGNVAVTSDRNAAGAGLLYTFGTLSIGSNTMTVQAGSFVENVAGTAEIKFGATTLTGASVFTVNNGSVATTKLTLGALAGTGGVSFTKNGGGQLLLGANASTFDGNSTLNAGQLLFARGNALGTVGTLTVNGGTISSDGVTARTITNPITLGGDFILGTVTEDGAITLSGAMDLGGSVRTITVNNTTDTISGIISNGGITKAGAGSLTLNGSNNAFTGNVTLDAGILRAAGTVTSPANALGIGASQLLLNGGELQFGSNNNRNYARNTTVAGNVTLTSDRNAAGAGLNYTLGTLSIGAQTLTIQGGVNATSGTATTTFSGAATMTGASTFTVNNNGLGATTQFTLGSTLDNGGFLATFGGTGNSTVTGIVSGAGGITKNGAGNLTLNGPNTYGGITTINGGAVVISADSGLGTAPGAATPGKLVLNNGALATSGTFALDANRGISLTGVGGQINVVSGTLTYGGIAAGGSALEKAGVGTLILTGSNSYTGTTVISNGAVSVATVATNLGGTGTIQLGSTTTTGTLITTGTANETITRAINLAGTSGGGTITNNNSAANLLIFQANIGSNVAGSKTLTLNGTSTGANNISGIISDSTVSGTTSVLVTDGIWILSGNNTFTGGVTVNSGSSVRAGHDNGFGTGTLTLAGGAWNSSGSHTLANNIVISATSTGNSLSADTDFTGQISGTGNWSSNGFAAGKMKFSGDNSGWSGNFRITGQNTLQLNHVNALGTGTTFTFSDNLIGMGVLESLVDLSGTGLAQDIVLGLTGAGIAGIHPEFKTTADMKLTGVISGPAGIGILKTGAGTLTLTNTNTYDGATTISAGTVQLGSGGTTGSISNSSSISVASGAALKTNRSDSITLSQAIAGAGNVEIANTGGGSTILGNASNAYTGTTTVTSGSLQVGSGGTGATGTGAVSVVSGSTILGTGIVQGSSFTAQSGATVQAGDGTAQGDYGTLTFTPVSGSGSFDFQSGSSVILGINPGGTSDLLNFIGTGSNMLLFNGNLTVGPSSFTPMAAATFNLLDWSGLTGTPTFASRYSAGSYSGPLLGNGDDNLGFDLSDISGSGFAWDISQFTTNGTISIVVVPEPCRSVLLLLGGAGLLLRRRRPFSLA